MYASISSRVFPLVSGTRKNAKSHAAMLTLAYNQKVAASPITRVSVQNDTATIRLPLQWRPNRKQPP